MNYKQTEEVYRKSQFPYKRSLEQIDIENWMSKVTNEAGDYHQLDTLS
jgi:hypothetical protein